MEVDALHKTYRRYAAIGWVLFLDLSIYVVVVEILRRMLFPFHGFVQLENVQPVRYVFFGLALGNFFLLKRLPRRIVESVAGECRGAPGGENSGEAVLKKLGLAALAIYAMCEAVGLLGLISFLLFGLYRDFFVYIFLTLIYLAMFYPKYHEWEEMIKAHL